MDGGLVTILDDVLKFLCGVEPNAIGAKWECLKTHEDTQLEIRSLITPMDPRELKNDKGAGIKPGHRSSKLAGTAIRAHRDGSRSQGSIRPDQTRGKELTGFKYFPVAAVFGLLKCWAYEPIPSAGAPAIL